MCGASVTPGPSTRWPPESSSSAWGPPLDCWESSEATTREYTATILLGASTTTDDREGDVIAQATTPDIQHVTDAAIAETVSHFTGALEQRPSAVSAVKVDGKRAYQRVRDGEEVDLPARAVTVEEFTILDIRRHNAAGFSAIDVDVRVRCSAGTYIRSLARDVGEGTRCGGHLTELRRTRSRDGRGDRVCRPRRR